MVQKLLLAFIHIFCYTYLHAQSDGCSSATPIAITATCVTPTNGTTIGATETIPGCVGNADDDVWYSFVATGTSHQINVVPSGGMDAVVQLFSGACAVLNTLTCKDDAGFGGQETINATNLVPGTTYTIRVYHYFAGSGSGTFSICVTNPPPAPSNDNCANAIPLNINSTCVPTAGTTLGATQSLPGCSGSADDDVWYSFVATSSVQQVTVAPTTNIDVVAQVYSGSCGSLTSISCNNAAGSSMNEQFNLVGLVTGQTYYIRVYDFAIGTNGDFTICIQGTVTPTPSNDNPCNAIQMPPVTSNCQYAQFTNVGATSTPLAMAPTPSNCAGGGGAMIGGYNASTADVWFAITVPASGNIHINAQPNIGSGAITDGVMALYSGSCSSLTQIACSDDYSNYPGSGHDMLPLISANGLTPGSTVYLRYWGFNTQQGTFGFCVTTATNDDCNNALYICDLNGYSASTSGAYTADRPGNMHGNNETQAGVNLTDGTNSGGVFGYYPFPGTSPGPFSSPLLDVNIENNSWIKFTASSTTATLNVSIFDCWIGNYPSGGIQMQIFDGTNCTNFVPVSNFEESSTGFTITGNGLTVGNDYYLMIDGYAGDICNYTISAQSGVQFPDITDVPPICPGESVTLVAPPGATSYNWLHDGSSTQSVNVTPSTSQTYYCVVTGLCDYTQTLEVDVQIKPLPVIAINGGSSAVICQGETVNLTATGAASYSWNTGQNTATINVSPSATTNYSVTGTLNGCTDSQNINVIVNNPPTLNAGATITSADCGTANGSITNVLATGVPTLSYSWTDVSMTQIATSQNLTNVVSGNYTLTVTDGNGCTLDSTFNINVLNFENPTIVASTTTPCFGTSITLTANHTDPTATFVWSGPGINGTNNTQNPITLTTSTAGMNSYSVVASIPGCSAASNPFNITVLPLPMIDISALDDDSTICENGTVELTANGASSFSWIGPNSFSANTQSIIISPFTSLNEGIYVVTGTDASGCINSDTIELMMVELPQVDAMAGNSSGVFCGESTISLNASGANSYQWTGPNGFSSTAQNPNVFTATAQNQGWYLVTGINAENCANSDSVYVSVVTDVLTVAAASDSVICPGEDVNFTASGGESYTWSGPDGLYTENSAFTIYATTPENTGWYYVTVTDSNGCFGFDSTYLSVAPNAKCLFIPDLTTPDLDGHNDYWEIHGLENFTEAVVEIYNRWGNLVYTASPYKNDWDGTVNNGATIGSSGKVPVGTYFYIITLNDEDNTPPFKGYLEVQY